MKTRRLFGLLVLHPGFVHRLAEDLLQPLVARQAEEVIDLVLFAPGHQFLAAEAGVGAQHDLHFRPPGAQLPGDAPDLVQSPFGRVLVGRPQPRAQQLVAGEDVQRQVAVAVVEAMEEPLRLMAMERDVGRVEIEHNLLGRRCVRLDEQIAQQRVDLLRLVVDLVIALIAARKLQPVQRALARKRLVERPLAAQHRHQRIVPQLLVIVEIFVAQRESEDALREHLAQPVHDPIRTPLVGKRGRQSLEETDPALACRNNRAPPSLEIRPPVKLASTRREKRGAN